MHALESFRVRAPLLKQGILDLNGSLASLIFLFI
jgi:hypothetical protein